MSYGLRIQDRNGKTIYDSNSYSVRVIYNQSFSNNGSALATFTHIVTGDLGANYMIWVEGARGAGDMPFKYTVSGTTVTVQAYAGSTYVIYAVSFG